MNGPYGLNLKRLLSSEKVTQLERQFKLDSTEAYLRITAKTSGSQL